LKILVSWLREYAAVPASAPELASALGLCGFEVASVEPAPGETAAGEDGVIDFEITANRPDCLSVLGMAREAATRFGAELRTPRCLDVLVASDRPLPLPVTIEAPDQCPRYAAAMADVTVGPSPAWMQRRLAAAGIRAINNIVDVTNYVLLELGHPLHAFDYDRLGGHALRIRRARSGERVTTLDGQARTLADDMLVIADAANAQAIAGVMGGGHSEVSSSTRVVALESAYFQPASIRRTGKRLGLSTEASYRFERGADPEMPVMALARACQLLEQVGAGHVRPGWVDEYPGRRPATVLTLRLERVTAILGRAVAAGDIARILGGLGFGVDDSGSERAWRVTVPGWRGDVTREIDLIEEIARHDGYDRIPTTFPVLAAPPSHPDPRLDRDRLARRIAAAMGFSECVTVTFIERAAAAAFSGEDEQVAIANPLSEKFTVLRPSLLAGLVDALAHNRRRERRDVRLFETGSRFTRSGGEARALALAWTGTGAAEHWSGSGRPVDFFDIKGAVEAVCTGLGLSQVSYAEADCDWLVPGRAAGLALRRADGTTFVFGTLGQLSPRIAAARGLPPSDEIYVAEVDLDALAGDVSFGTDLTVTPLPRHPSVVRDLSVLVDERLPAALARATIQSAAPATLVEVTEFARYQGQGIAVGQVSLSFRLTFRAGDRTLTDEEVQLAMERVLAALGEAHGARLR
jgi:phenylalanyl-tRNA synthetase beta chain